jgi:hypothetical protein
LQGGGGLEADDRAPYIRPMTDPSSPEILAWLDTLPLGERLTMLHAFPQLQTDISVS